MTQSGHFLEQTLRTIGLVYTGAMTKHGKRLDRVLEKALNTPPKPHKTNKKKDCECPLFPIAAIQIAYISPKPAAANGQ